jgi:ABC-type spermidine/putrescine transport system permease subunit II
VILLASEACAWNTDELSLKYGELSFGTLWEPLYIGTKLRQFISPVMNALAVIFIVLTVIGATVYEIKRRHEASRE